ncbi:MAG: hypothetical protein H0T89_36715 [Deltaproteobacteria bacterium]|nr:hypothetical protein [Deltaproteobacteria bacterium]
MWKWLAPIAFALVAISTRADAAEICGNGLDDDANGATDESCYPTLTTGQCESPLSCEDTGMISPSSGSTRYSLPPDIAPKVPFGPGIGMRRFYLSKYAPGTGAPAYRKPMGERWGHTYATWLDDVSNGGPKKIVLHTTRGQDILMNKTSSDATWEYFTPQPGFHFKHVRRRLASPFEYELKQLTGEVMVYNTSGRLTEIWDTLATPNKVLVAYDGNGQVSTVIDASGKRRLLFAYTTGMLTSLQFQLYVSSVWTTYHTTTYAYTSGQLTSVTIGGQLAQSNIYTSSYLTQINDGAGNEIVSFAYDAATAGKTVRADTPRGMVGWEYNSSRTSCSGKTVLYFNRGNTTSCSVDSDCGSGLLCGGKTGTGSTGVCFRGARCLTVTSPSEDVVTTVTALGPPGETCDGTCLDVAQYIWNTGTSVLDLKAVQDPSGNYTARAFNTNGLPTKITYGDRDSDPSNTGATREVFLYYDTNFPGRLTEVRKASELWNAGACTATDATYCAKTVYTYNSDGKLTLVTNTGNTLHGTNTVVGYSSSSSYTYDTKGRLTRVDGPSPEYAVTLFEYWTSTSPLEDGFLQYYKRQKGTSSYLTQSSLAYDFWGNATAVSDPDGTLSCQTYDAARGYLAEQREAMAGQTSCTTNSADLVTGWLRDSALRLTKLTRPDGSCLHYEYDTKGRLSKTKRRDDCNATSSGEREEYTYSADSLLTKIERFDAAGTVTHRREMTYFDSRRLEKLINPADTSKWTGLIYDSFGLVSEVNGGGNLSKTTYTRDIEGRVQTESRYRTSSAYDSWSLLYDWIGNQKQVTDGDSKITKSVRDDRGFTVRLESPDLGGYPTLRLYDDANRLSAYKERVGGTGSQTHTYYYDQVRRTTAVDYQGYCTGSAALPEIEYTYDAMPSGVTCPISGGCNRILGRLAYVKVTLMCSTAYTDKTLDQETFYSYDDAGRIIREYIRDDTGRTAEHQYTWTKNGALAQTTTPSGAVLGATFGSTGSNSDTDRISALWRTSTSTP